MACKQLVFNPIALRKAKIAYNFGLSGCNRVKQSGMYRINCFHLNAHKKFLMHTEKSQIRCTSEQADVQLIGVFNSQNRLFTQIHAPNISFGTEEAVHLAY